MRAVAGSPEFDTTNWQLVAAACSPSIATRRDALGEVFKSYEGPIRAWLRSNGWPPHRADDLTQEFFKTVVLERRLLDGASNDRGRLRTLMLAALRNLAIDASRHDDARHRADRSATEPTTQDAADAAFDAEWVRTQLDRAVCKVRQRLIQRRPQQWQAFEEVVLGPSLRGHAVRPLTEIARALGLRDAATVSYLIHETKRAIRRELNAQVSLTVGDSAAFSAEIAHVESVLAAAVRQSTG